MKWRWVVDQLKVAWGGVLLVGIVALALAKDLDELVSWTSILGFFVALVGLVLSIWKGRQAVGPGQARLLNRAKRDLAVAVGRQWRAEERLRRVHDPFPLPVRWMVADPAVSDGWAYGDRSDAAGSPAGLSGQLEQIVEVFDRVPSKRLVVLGSPGAGKTVLTSRFTLDLLAARKAADRVPVIFSLASWHPERQSLQSWMAARLCVDHPALGSLSSSGLTWAAELVRTDCVLPVLDGLDEIPAELRTAALRQLDQTLDHDSPVLVTCRSQEYRETVQTAGALARAAVVELLPLTRADLAEYLPRTVRIKGPPSGKATAKWEPVLRWLGQNSGLAAADALLDVLSNPLMTSMARAIYSETEADPVQLLDDRFGEPATLAQHLLDVFIPAAYACQVPSLPEPEARLGCYRADRAVRWLRFLAAHIGACNSYDLAWWEHCAAVSRRARMLLVGLTCGLAFGMVATLAAGPVAGMAYGVAFGAAGVATGGGIQSKPSRVEVRFRGTGITFMRRFMVGLVAGVVLGLAFKLPEMALFVLALAFGLAVGLHGWLDLPTDATRVPSPAVALRQDRIATMAYGISFALPFGIAYGATFQFSDDLPGTFKLPFQLAFGLSFGLAGAVAGGIAGRLLYGWAGGLAYALVGMVVGGLVLPPARSGVLSVVLGIMFGLSVGYLVVLSRAWGLFALCRIWLALRGRHPWRLMRFLADAHSRGVLRQAGGVYQFRHASLQDRLVLQDQAAGSLRPEPLREPRTDQRRIVPRS